MPYDFTLGRGPLKSSRHNAGKANTIDVPVIGVVKDNIDPTRSGRIRVFLSTNLPPLDPDNSDNWTTVNYLSGFFGSVRPTGGEEEFGTYKRNPSSYGEWHSPPDIGTQVICVFVNGDPNYGFYIGCIPRPEDLYMVPAIGSSENIIPNEGEAASYGGAVRLPVTNFNTANKEIADSPDYIGAPRPVHSYTAAIMAQQGIIRDPIRGPISSSSQREAASRVGWGVSTPGRPIYEGGFNDETVTQNLDPSASEQLRVISRRGGHSIVMDDGDVVGRDQLVRIRTALGHQILMSDDGQTLMILHSNGQSYIELGKEGTVDVYSTNSINMRTDGDINFHAGRNINLHANEDFNVHGKNVQVDAEEELRLRAEGDFKILAFGNFTARSKASIALSSAGDSSIEAEGEAYVVGEKVNLNSGSAPTQAEEFTEIPLIAQTDTLFDEQQGFIAAPGNLNTITSRTPAHAPWAGAGQGVDVETSVDAKDKLPQAPSADVRNVNNLASEAVANQGDPNINVPSNLSGVKPISSALDKNTTSTILGILASSALNNDLQTGIGSTSNNQLGVGRYGQTPSQLSQAGYFKPGIDRRIDAVYNSLRSSQAPAIVKRRALPDLSFTGKSGSYNADSFTQNLDAQNDAAIKNLQKAQCSLTKKRVLTGKEAPSQVAGLVLSASTLGVEQTASTIQQVSQSAFANRSINSSKISNSSVLKEIGKGVLAAQASTTLFGGKGGIASALRSMDPNRPGGLLDSSKGVSGSAFSAIKNSLVPLQANVPQNLRQIAQQAGYGPVTGDTNLLSQTASIVQRGAQASASSLLASGVNSIPGGQRILSSVLNNAPGASNRLPGTELLRTQIDRLLQNNSPSIVLNRPGGLARIASDNLPIGGVAEIQSAAAALSSGSANKIKLPTNSFNTLDRKAISAKVDNLLFDPGIPPPNLVGEISPQATQALEAAQAEGQEVFGLLEEFDARQEEIASARNAFYEAQATLPEGDPAIEQARNEWFALLDDPEYKELIEEIRETKGTGVGFLSEDQVNIVNDSQQQQGQEGGDIDWNNLGRGSNDDATGIG